MIVCCPGCSTHYSHTEQDTLRIGRCSRCDERFTITAPKQRYILMPAGSTVSDPLLAAGVESSANRIDRPGPPMSTPIPEGVPIPEPAEYSDLDADDYGADAYDDDGGFFSAEMDDDEALFGIDEEVPQDEPVAAEPAPQLANHPRHPIREAMGVFLLGALGAAAGYQGSMEFGFEALDATGVGLAVGVTFGWAWIRWAERKR